MKADFEISMQKGDAEMVGHQRPIKLYLGAGVEMRHFNRLSLHLKWTLRHFKVGDKDDAASTSRDSATVMHEAVRE